MMERSLSQRVRTLSKTASTFVVGPVPTKILEGLKEALLGGETHYTDRPGMRALREAIAARLALPGRDEDTVVVTAGEEEARYVARLASKDVDVVSIGTALFEKSGPSIPEGVLVTGSLDALPGLSSFRVGFVCAPPELVAKVRSWKQALSICTAAPSQRAALLLMQARAERARPAAVRSTPASGGQRAPEEGARTEECTADERPSSRGWGPASLEQEMKTDEKRYSLMELAATLDGVISLGRGDPDLATPPHIIEGALERMRNPVASLTVEGLPELRAAVANRYRKDKGLEFDPDTEILITNGAQEGLFLSVLALLDPGEKILVPDPRYGSYDQAIATAGAESVSLPTGEGYDFGLTPGAVAAEAKGAKVVILVNPSNPTGAVTTPERVREISQIACHNALLAISDEVYESLVFDGHGVLSMAACEGMRDRTVTLSSLSKTYAMTGFRIGYLLGPPVFIEAATKLKADVSGPTALFSQYAALAALEGPRDSIETYRGIYASRRRVMTEGLDRLGIRYGKPGGGFFVWADIERFELDAETFCRRLLTEGRVLVFPGTAFGENWRSYVRISLLQTEERLEEALERMAGFLERI